MKKKLLIIYLILVLLVGTLLGLFSFYKNSLSIKRSLEKDGIQATKSDISTNKQVILPKNDDLTVPYAPQAPYGNWAVHEESCEEAAILMYHEFLNETTYPNNRIPDTTADNIMRTMKAWQISNYGAERDLTMDMLGKFAKDYYGLNYQVTNKINEDNIKSAIFNGSPIIVPVMTHSLQNNMYGLYTVYHVLLIKGYDETGVITNDAGVGNGPNHHYDWNILWQAIDAQTTKTGQGRVMLTISK